MRHHDYIQKGQKIFKLKSTVEKIRKKAHEAILNEFKSLVKFLPQIQRLEPSLVNIIPMLSEYYKCNIVVHETRGLDFIVYSQPDQKNYRHDWPRIDLHQKINFNQKFGHVCLISPRISPYASAYGWTCIFCENRTRGKSHRHRLWYNH